MTIQFGQIAPDFERDGTVGKLHPKVARLKPEWEKRHVKPIGLSVDSGEKHAGWPAVSRKPKAMRL
jgi:hypothetical protein